MKSSFLFAEKNKIQFSCGRTDAQNDLRKNVFQIRSPYMTILDDSILFSSFIHSQNNEYAYFIFRRLQNIFPVELVVCGFYVVKMCLCIL